MSLPELPAPDRTMWQHGQQIDHYTADQMRAYALQAVEALRPVAMTEEQRQQAFNKSWATSSDFFAGIEAAEAHHHITQKEQDK